MHRTWVEFMSTGHPGWPSYSLADRPTGLISDRLRIVRDPIRAQRLVWKGVRQYTDEEPAGETKKTGRRARAAEKPKAKAKAKAEAGGNTAPKAQPKTEPEEEPAKAPKKRARKKKAADD